MRAACGAAIPPPGRRTTGCRRIDPAPPRVEQGTGLGAFGGLEDLHGAALVGEQVHERDVGGHAALERALLFEVAAADLVAQVLEDRDGLLEGRAGAGGFVPRALDAARNR